MKRLLPKRNGTSLHGDIVLENPVIVSLMRGKDQKIQVVFQEYMPLKDGDEVIMKAASIVSTAPMGPENEVYKMYAQNILGHKIVTAPAAPIILTH